MALRTSRSSCIVYAPSLVSTSGACHGKFKLRHKISIEKNKEKIEKNIIVYFCLLIFLSTMQLYIFMFLSIDISFLSSITPTFSISPYSFHSLNHVFQPAYVSTLFSHKSGFCLFQQIPLQKEAMCLLTQDRPYVPEVLQAQSTYQRI